MDTNDHLSLLCDVNELSALLAGSADVEAFLGQVVWSVAKHLRSDVCSVYIYNEAADELVLRATKGLSADSVGQVKMKRGEGLVGLALQSGRYLHEKEASKHPQFKHFPGIDEEKYESFLAMPILRGVERIGVLVVQRATREGFEENDIKALRAIAAQLAGVVENARTLLALRQPEASPTPAAKVAPATGALLSGQVASEGYACAPSLTFDRHRSHFHQMPERFSTGHTLEDFRRALETTAKQLEELQQRIEARLPEMAALIFTAHLFMLRDRSFVGGVEARIAAGVNPPVAVLEVARELMERFSASPSLYLREKAKDVEDVARRVIGNIVHKVYEPTSNCEGRIVIAPELFASDVMKLSSEGVSGVVVTSGGLVSHVAILARSLQVPMVICEDQQLLDLPDGTPLLLDAEVGNVYIQPGADVVNTFTARNRARLEVRAAKDLMQPTTATRDGERVHLLANINLLSDLKLARDLQAEGVGLYRTEFPFLIRNDFPSEEEQVVIYRRLVADLPDRLITIRTLDVGGDKVLAYWNNGGGEENPAMGLRSIRLSLRYPDIFRQQLRAILRAGAGSAQYRLMFPMITTVDEFLEARQLVRTAAAELAAEGAPYCTELKIGMMVEVPSLVAVIDELAGYADFLCIGTNDFTQFLLAVDRGNEKVASYFLPHHPSVLRSLRDIVAGARRHHCDLSICGEMAHEERYIPFLLGIGMRNLSVDPRFLPRLQQQIRALSLADAERHAQELLATASIAEITRLLDRRPGAPAKPA